MNHSQQIINFIDVTFNEKKCHELCRKYKFIQRSTSKLKGYEFIKTMIFPSEGLSTDSLKGLCKRILEFNPEAILSAQALCERINDVSSCRLMQGVFAELILKVHEHITWSCPKITKALSGFNRVLIEDSTVARLNEKLETEYKGTNRGGTGVKAQVKIDLIYDLKKGLLLDAKLFRGNEPDQALAGRILKFIEPGDLVIRDLGYFVMNTFKTIDLMKAYFLSRLQPKVNFYLKEDDKRALDIGKYMGKKENSYSNFVEINGFLGPEKIPSRLIIYRQPQEVTDKRIEEAKKTARSKGYTMGERKKISLQFAIFVTNAPAELLSAEIVGTIYRLRWEIELIFKRWKSQLEIDYLKGIHKDRIDCLIWSRLCTVLIVELITGAFKQITNESYELELSEVKLIDYLMRCSKFLTSAAKNKLEDYFEQMIKDIPRMLLKDKRSRQTMRERVANGEYYYGMEVTENQYVA